MVFSSNVPDIISFSPWEHLQAVRKLDVPRSLSSLTGKERQDALQPILRLGLIEFLISVAVHQADDFCSCRTSGTEIREAPTLFCGVIPMSVVGSRLKILDIAEKDR